MWLCACGRARVCESFSMTVGVLLHIKLRANVVDVGIFKKKYVCGTLAIMTMMYINILFVWMCSFVRSLWAHVCVHVFAQLQRFKNAMIVGWVYECVSFLSARSYVHIYSHLAAALSFIFTSKYSLTLTQTQAQQTIIIIALFQFQMRSFGAWTAITFLLTLFSCSFFHRKSEPYATVLSTMCTMISLRICRFNGKNQSIKI